MDIREKINSGAYMNKLPMIVPVEVLDSVTLPEDFGSVRTADDVKRATAKLNEMKDALKVKYRTAHNKEESRVLDQFWADVEEEYREKGINDNQWGKITAFAWEYGHSGGLYDVVGWVEELVDLVRP